MYMMLSSIFIVLLIDRLKYIRLITLLLSLTLIVGITAVSPTVKKRMVDTTLEQVGVGSDRLVIFSPVHESHIRTAFNMFFDKPILGDGPKMFRVKCSDPKYAVGINPCSTHPHNFYVDKLKNFGISSQDNVDYSGLNMKLSELHAAFGLVGFDNLETEIKNRADLAKIYIDKLSNLKGVTIVITGDGFTPNWSYFVIRINEVEAGISRDTLFEILKSLNIYCRKYFSPLMSESFVYRNLPSANHNFLPIAHRFAREILCLPIYGDLESSIVKKISKAILYHVLKVK